VRVSESWPNAGAATRPVLVPFELFDAGGDLSLERDDVFGVHPGKPTFVVAVQ